MKLPRLLIGLAALALLAAPASASATSSVSEHEIGQSPGEVLDFWTPERIEAAEPIVAPESEGAGSVDGGAQAASVAPDQETNPALDTSYPQRVHGRLLVLLDGQLGQCSASVVTAQSRSLILTAAHCLVVPGEASGGRGIIWASNVAFQPGFRNGVSPFGNYAGTNLGTPTAFAQSGDVSFDLGAVNLAPGASGLIQDALGARGVAFNRNPDKYRGNSFEVWGYPAMPAPAYDGQRLILCYTTFQGFESFTSAPVVAPCNQQQGSSGGGFVRGGKVESVVSHAGCINVTGCTLIAGSYFGEEEFQLYKEISGGISKGKKKRLKKCKQKPKGEKRTKCRGRVQRFSEDPR